MPIPTTQFPGAIDTPAGLQRPVNNWTVALQAAVAIGDTTINVGAGPLLTLLAAAQPTNGVLSIGNEVILYGWIDTAAISAFAGGNDAFVRTWYDGGTVGGWDMTQASTGSQPRIVAAGIMDTLGGIAAVHAHDNSRFLEAVADGGEAASHMASAVASLESATSNFGRLLSLGTPSSSEENSANTWAALLRSGANQQVYTFFSNRAPAALNVTYGSAFLLQTRIGTNTVAARVNASAENINSADVSPNLTYTRARIFRVATASPFWRGRANEITLYATDPGSTIRDFVRDNQNAAFSVY